MVKGYDWSKHNKLHWMSDCSYGANMTRVVCFFSISQSLERPLTSFHSLARPHVELCYKWQHPDPLGQWLSVNLFQQSANPLPPQILLAFTLLNRLVPSDNARCAWTSLTSPALLPAERGRNPKKHICLSGYSEWWVKKPGFNVSWPFCISLWMPLRVTLVEPKIWQKL